jgi:hypothetical protein
MFSVQFRRKGNEVTQIMLGPIGCTETSVRNYHYTLRNMPEDRTSHVDTITMVTLKLHSLETFLFQKGTRHAPYIFMQSVPSPLHSIPLTDLHAIRISYVLMSPLRREF